MTDLLTRIEQNQPIEAQELYDYIVEAIVKQGRPSVGDNDRCLYRGPDGLKCAYGHVIPDSLYSEELEGESVEILADRGKFPETLQEHEALLQNLQYAHDTFSDAKDFLASFVRRAGAIARNLNLKPYGDKT